MKIAIVTDSNSGITQKQAQELGVFVLAMPFQIDGETYYEDITLTQEEFYKKLREGGNISTSQPSPGSVTDLWDKILQEYDQIVHIPMSSVLSGSCQTAIMLAQEEEYEGKVYVVNNQRISVTQRQSVLDAKKMAEAGYDAAAIQKRLEETKFDSTIYITLDTLQYLLCFHKLLQMYLNLLLMYFRKVLVQKLHYFHCGHRKFLLFLLLVFHLLLFHYLHQINLI